MPSGRTQEVATESMLEALSSSLTIEQAAQLCGCSAPLLSVRSKQDPRVAAAIVAQDHRKEDLLEQAILARRGVLSMVAKDVGLGSSAAVRYHIVRSTRLQQAFDESRNVVVDKAEDNVFRAVENGSVKDSWRLLATLGKDRGYTERREIDQHVEHTVEVKSTGELFSMLERLATGSPQAVEAEFSVLSNEDRSLLTGALERLSGGQGGMAEQSVEVLSDRVQ